MGNSEALTIVVGLTCAAADRTLLPIEDELFREAVAVLAKDTQRLVELREMENGTRPTPPAFG